MKRIIPVLVTFLGLVLFFANAFALGSRWQKRRDSFPKGRWTVVDPAGNWWMPVDQQDQHWPTCSLLVKEGGR